MYRLKRSFFHSKYIRCNSHQTFCHSNCSRMTLCEEISTCCLQKALRWCSETRFSVSPGIKRAPLLASPPIFIKQERRCHPMAWLGNYAEHRIVEDSPKEFGIMMGAVSNAIHPKRYWGLECFALVFCGFVGVFVREMISVRASNLR